MNPEDRPLCAIHFGTAESEAQACETANMMKTCSYTVMYVPSGINVVGVLVLPESKRWWADLRERPELLGLKSLQVFFSSRVDVHSPWSMGLGRAELPVPPCGSLCESCPHYREKCAGCPASQFFQKPRSNETANQ
jgi:hypothetical protein